jgi:hypothetical protein
MPTGVGLASIPIIIKPIDNAVDYLLENMTQHWIVEEGETNYFNCKTTNVRTVVVHSTKH